MKLLLVLRNFGFIRAAVLFLTHEIFSVIRTHVFRVAYTFNYIGRNVKLHGGIEFDNQNVSIGNNVIIGKACRFGGKGLIEIGDNTTVGAYTCFESAKKIVIGPDTQIARFCYFIDHNHYMGSKKTKLTEQTNYENDMKTAKPIIIKGNAWFGVQSIILKGVSVGQGSVIGAGSVVTKNIPPYVVAAGVPARIIKKR